MVVNDKDFYASYGLDFDYKNMLDVFITGVVNQAKIEVLTEIQSEMEESCICAYQVKKLIQQKINALEEKINDN